MARLIDADKVIDDIIDDKYYDEDGGGFLEGEERAIYLIESAHTVEERQHGEWNPDGTCSQCGVYSSLNKDTTYFCPNCGSDMRPKEGEKND